MITFGGLVGLVASAFLLIVGIVVDQGWLVFLAMIATAITLVGGVFALPATRPIAQPHRERAARPQRTPPSVAEVGFVFLVLVIAALLVAGVLFDLGWLAFLGMMAMGLGVVYGFKKAARA